MTRCFRGPVVLTAACFLVFAALPARAADAPTGKLLTRTYPVADLVVPLPNEKKCERNPGEKTPLEQQLISLIVRTIQTNTWNVCGGPGNIEYYPLTMSLVVSQTADVHEEIDGLLTALRRQLDTEVALEVRLISVSDDSFERIGIDFNRPGHANDGSKVEGKSPEDVSGSPAMKFLTDIQVHQLLEALQGDRRTNIMQCPKMTLFNGQAATLQVTEQQCFVTAVDPVAFGGQVALVPKCEPTTTGLRMTAQPVISADRHFVRLYLKLDQTDLAFPVPVVPVAAPPAVAPSKTPPATSFVQQPKFTRFTMEKTATLPDGGTIVFAGLKKLVEHRTETCPPVLSKVPYVNRLFKSGTVSTTEGQKVLVMVTPRIIVNQQDAGIEEQEPSCKDEPTGKRHARVVVQLLKMYDLACEKGQVEEARKLAQAALILDPTCFHGKR